MKTPLKARLKKAPATSLRIWGLRMPMNFTRVHKLVFMFIQY